MTEAQSQAADWRRPVWGCLQIAVMALGFGSVILNAILLGRYMFPADQLGAEDLQVPPSARQKQPRLADPPDPKYGNNSLMMHGHLGLNPDGSPAHVPGPPPPPVGHELLPLLLQ